MKVHLVYCLVIVVLMGAIALVYNSGEVAKVELEYQLKEKDVLIEGYRELQKGIYVEIDSIDVLRDEKINTEYRLAADSLERIFAERFGKD